jgi:hypothetical protein
MLCSVCRLAGKLSTLSAEINVQALPVFGFYKVRDSLGMTMYVLLLDTVYDDVD